MRKNSILSMLVCAMAVSFFVPASYGLDLTSGDIKASGYFESMNIWRTENFEESPKWIQNRNTFQLEYDALLLKNKYGLDKLALGGVFRAWYDGAYHYGDADKPPTFSQHGKDGIYSEIEFREQYLDGDIGKFNFRIGRQQVAWGKTDFFRLADIVNPLDYSRHFFYEDFRDWRIPLWMGKFLYRFGDVGPLSDVNFELIVNPGDFEPTNYGVPGMPWALVGTGFDQLPQDLPPRWHLSSFEVGERVEFKTGLVWWAANHFYGYQDDGVLNFQNLHLVYPKKNTFGLSFDYSNDYTGIVLRFESTYVPDKVMGVDSSRQVGLDLLSKYPDGLIEKDELKFSFGIDRITWIPALNPDQTFFLSAQLFMTQILDYENGITNDGSPALRTDPTITVVANTGYMHDRLKPQVFALYKARGDGLGFGASLEFLHTNHLSYKIGLNTLGVVHGRESTFAGFGNQTDRDEFYARVRYAF